MKTGENHFMVDIETTGVNRDSDKLLQVGMVEIMWLDGYWHPVHNRSLDITLHYPGQPANEFAKKHMSALYKKCNETPTEWNVERLGTLVREFIHREMEEKILVPVDSEYGHPERITVPVIKPNVPRLFIGWNASNFDLPFLFDNKVLTPSYYEADPTTGKETLRGDAHYRIYELTGSVQLLCDSTGLSRQLICDMASELNPTGIQLPKGKEHDALYDCYKQIIMQNGLIKISRMGIRK